MCGGRLYIHISHILFALFDVALGDFFRRYTLLDGFCNDLVIHIREIGYIVYFISLVLHISSHCVEDDHGSGISDVDKIVYGRTAHIHFYFSFLQRNEVFFSLCQGIVNLHVSTPFLLLIPEVRIPASAALTSGVHSHSAVF